MTAPAAVMPISRTVVIIPSNATPAPLGSSYGGSFGVSHLRSAELAYQPQGGRLESPWVGLTGFSVRPFVGMRFVPPRATLGSRSWHVQKKTRLLAGLRQSASKEVERSGALIDLWRAVGTSAQVCGGSSFLPGPACLRRGLEGGRVLEVKGVEPTHRRRHRLLSVRRGRLTFMLGHPGACAQGATVIKWRFWGNGLVLPGCRSGGVLESLKSCFLPRVVPPGFPATHSATRWGHLQPWL